MPKLFTRRQVGRGRSGTTRSGRGKSGRVAAGRCVPRAFMMVTTVRGQFKSFRGQFNLDTNNFTRSTFEGEIDVASVDTGNADRDNHLRNNDFFDAPNHPKITFKSTSIEAKTLLSDFGLATSVCQSEQRACVTHFELATFDERDYLITD